MNLRCLPGQVIVEPMFRSNRYLPIVAANKQPPAEGKVVALGIERRRKDGSEVPPLVFKGAWVVFRPFNGKEIEFGGKKLRLMWQKDLEAVYTA